MMVSINGLHMICNKEGSVLLLVLACRPGLSEFGLLFSVLIPEYNTHQERATQTSTSSLFTSFAHASPGPNLGPSKISGKTPFA